MRVTPVGAPRASNRVSKNSDTTRSRRQRKREVTLDQEDDDWAPKLTTLTPKRVISEFFENDYDVM